MDISEYMEIYVRLALDANYLAIAQVSQIEERLRRFEESLRDYERRMPENMRAPYEEDLREFAKIYRRKKSQLENMGVISREWQKI